jgi:phage/plasmid-like protein (TIGR03299 family)
MAHELDFSKGFAAIAYTGAKPWHGFGADMTLRPDATVADWRTAAGLDYAIQRAPVCYESIGHGSQMATGNDVLYRDDNGSHVGIVSSSFQIVQPKTIAEFFMDVSSDAGFKLETMGALRNGAVYWALVRTGHIMGEKRGDPIEGFALISTAADGSASTCVQQTSTRVVCANTLAIAHQGSKGAVRVRHSTMFDALRVKRDMGLIDFDASWEAFRANLTTLAQTPVDEIKAREFLANLLRPAVSASAQALVASDMDSNAAAAIANPVKERAIRGLESLFESYTSALGAVPGTAYGLLQGVTHWVDHVRGNPDKRLQSSWFGQGATLKAQAIDQALALAA